MLLGKTRSEQIYAQIHQSFSVLRQSAPSVPGLGILQLGNRFDSSLFIASKKKTCEKLGFSVDHRQLPEAASLSSVLSIISDFNEDPSIHGIILQLPLSLSLKPFFNEIVSKISLKKDVDCLNPASCDPDSTENHFSLKHCLKKTRLNYPCVALSVKELLDQYRIDCEKKHVVVAGSSYSVGVPIKQLFESRGGLVSICDSMSADLTRSADILVCATGARQAFGRNHVKENSIVFDVGINVDENNKVWGDVVLEDVIEKVAMITPVPGGLGPITAAYVLKNLYTNWLRMVSEARGEYAAI